jgi:hypothetical protein
MKFVRTALVCAVMAASTSAFATTLNLTNASSTGYSWSRNYSADGINLSVTAYSGGYVNSSNQEVGTDIARREIGAYGTSGIGVERAGNPEHATDNNNGNFDMFLFTFDQAVELDALSLGWIQNDSDMTVLAYTGAGSASSNFSGNKWDQALATGWTGRHYLDVADLPGDATAVNPTNLRSTSWLIGTQLWSLDNVPTTDGTPNSGATGVDFVKLKTVTFSTPPVSVPEIDGAQAGLAMGLLLSLMAAFRERRFSRKAKI